MPEPRWDLEALDAAAARARLWRMAPVGVVVLMVGSVLLGAIAGAVVLTATHSLPALMGTMFLGYLPAIVGVIVLGVRNRGRRQQLPGPGWTVAIRLAQIAFLLGAGALVGLATTVFDSDDPLFLVASAGGGLVMILPLTWFAAPTGPWLPPRWANPVLTLLFAVPVGLLGVAVAVFQPSQGETFGLLGITLIAPALTALRGAADLHDQAARGNHVQALAALTHWRIGRLRFWPRASILLLAGKLEDARALAETWVRRSQPRSWGSLLQLAGETALWLDDLDGARQHARVALAVSPDEPTGYLLAARHDLAAGTVDELTHSMSERMLEHAERRSPGAMMASQRQRATEALAEMRLIHAHVQATLGNRDDARKERDDALAGLERSRCASTALLLHHAAAVDQALGEDPGPRRREAAELDPSGIGARLLTLSEGAG